MFKCIIIPLITASLITGVANTNLKQSTRMAKVAMTYYVSTTILAVIVSLGREVIFIILYIHSS
jgi:Na+/H+-dicarboxylate symporter